MNTGIFVLTGAHFEGEVNMDKHGSVVCAVILTLCALAHFDTVFSAKAGSRFTGRCPRSLKVVPSQKGCECDQDCPADNVCCVYGGEAVCVPPAFTKPGVCPRRKWGFGLCAEFCSDDSDCPNNEKCCSNGCGHECVAPYTVKHGRCPLPEPTLMCAEYCYHDGQCPGAQKCCKTTCGHVCTEPC